MLFQRYDNNGILLWKFQKTIKPAHIAVDITQLQKRTRSSENYSATELETVIGNTGVSILKFETDVI